MVVALEREGLWGFASDMHGSTWCWKSRDGAITTPEGKTLRAPKGTVIFWSGESGIPTAVAARSFVAWLNRVSARAS